MAGIKGLVNKRISKKVKFMNEDIVINKLSVSEVFEIQEKAKLAESDDNAGYELLKHVIRIAVEDAKDLTDEDFESFPMDELSSLSNAIIKFSGITGDVQGK